VPVANQGEDENQDGDHNQSRGLEIVNMRLGMFRRMRVASRLWASFRHGNIVALTEASPPSDTISRMPAPSTRSARRIFRFGVFEADLASGELRKSGLRIRLQDQPFQLLTFLLERSGQLVTREEIREKLWPADTFVDFDHSLNTAIAKLREALGDSATTPRYVETLARRGYRFLASVESVDPQGQQGEAAVLAQHPELEIPTPHRALPRSLFALIQIMYFAFYVAALFHLPEIDRIAEGFLPAWAAVTLFSAVLVTAGVGIPLRCYLLSSVGFDYRRLGEKFHKLFVFILILDELWAVAPLLLSGTIGFGAAFAATAALLYVPFSERTLIRMAYERAGLVTGG
jgi:cholera toxin transcriptional activator